jgi:hypothetical protein
VRHAGPGIQDVYREMHVTQEALLAAMRPDGQWRIGWSLLMRLASWRMLSRRWFRPPTDLTAQVSVSSRWSNLKTARIMGSSAAKLCLDTGGSGRHLRSGAQPDY